MAPRRSLRARDTQLAFEALTIEGALLSPEWLAKIAQLQAKHQADADYRILKGLSLRDEIGRFWRVAQAHWTEFKAGRERQADPAQLAERFAVGLLREAFGFGTLTAAEPVVVGERTYPIGHHAMEGRVPVVVAPAGVGVETHSPSFGDEGRKRSAFGLVQEYLNADDRALWGLSTDGLTLRLCRDNASLTRPAWLEADLGRIFQEERYADFAALWLLIHESRFGAPGQPVADCPLEVWRNAGREEGTRAREKLREGVEEALVALGRGFLTRADNHLREALDDGRLTRDAFFQQLLRLVYRIIFMLTAEERDVLHAKDASPEGRALYAEGYSLRRLRERAAKRSAHDRFCDQWEALKIIFRGVAKGEPRFGLPALGGLFASDQCPDLETARLENRWLLTAIFKLSWVRETAGLARVNWRDMGPEELGSVYESLLELVPQIPEDGRGFSFATGDATKGNARKTTGSYYTPDSLVQVLLDSALTPVIQATVAAHPEDPAEALLQLSVVDPACGSGHFLLAAARRIADQVARFQAKGTPSAEQYRHAVRQVVSRCLFGVDLNPMAVELCRVSLWMEAVEPGRPLSFLDSHIQRGNALLGATPELMKKGIPDAAFDPIEGDDKKTASMLKKRNKEVAQAQGLFDTLWSKAAGAETTEVARAVAELDAAPDADLAAVAAKLSKWEQVQGSGAYRHQKFVADAWCAAFVWPKPAIESAGGGKQKRASPIVEAAPTSALWLQMQSGQGSAPALTQKTVEDLATHYRFFHWHLAFPQVFSRGGFDVVLGNPPWDRVTFEEREWFAQHAPTIAFAPTAAKRRAMIASLERADATLFARYQAARRATSGTASFCAACGRFPLTAVGHFNTYALFTELASDTLVAKAGRAALVAPTAVVTGDYSKALTRKLIETGRLEAVFDFDNRGGFFPDMQPNVRFAIVAITGAVSTADAFTQVASQLRSVTDLRGTRISRLRAGDVLKMNPETATIPFFYSARDGDLVAALYRARPSLFDAQGTSTWSVDFGRMLNMSDDSEGFVVEEALPADPAKRRALLPVYEAKLTAQYDHRAGTFEGVPAEDRFRLHAGTIEPSERQKQDPEYAITPRYWLPSETVEGDLGKREYFLAYRDAISATADARSLAACVLPRVPSVHTLLNVWTENGDDAVAFAGAFNSFAIDYVLRQKATGAHAARFIVRQLPFATRSEFEAPAPWCGDCSMFAWMRPRVVELSYTTWALEPFAKDVGHDGAPFRWDSDRRFLLRAELDSAFFHFYGISHDDAAYILDTFPIVRKNDEKAHGEYRTKRVILEIYDAMAEAIRTGKPYKTRLDPPPADPRCAHPANSKPKSASSGKPSRRGQ